jgi:hypothetical protein
MITNKSNKNIAPTKKIRSISGKPKTVKSRIPSRNNAIKIRNSEIKSSSIKPSTISSSGPSRQSISSGISTSKTIVLEDASEYVSDNVDF